MISHRAHIIASSPWFMTFRSGSCLSNRVLRNEETSILKQFDIFGFQNNFKCKSTGGNQNSLSEIKENENVRISLVEKVKQTTKDASYLGVIIAGIGVTGVMFYAIIRELFSTESSHSVYSDAFKLCCDDPRVIDALGAPVKGYGELSRRGRRRHVSHVEYEKDGKNYMRMKFYVKGSRKEGTVHLEVKKEKNKKYEYRYLFVDIEDFVTKTIILKDNRYLDES